MGRSFNARLILLIGLPGSGKSTLAEFLVRREPDWVLISTDALRKQLFGDERVQGPWALIQQEIERSLHLTATQALQGRVRGAICDATHAVRKHRRQAIALARRCGFTHITALWLDVPLAVCLERNAKRQRQVPVAVIERMNRRLLGASPRLDEGIDCLVRYGGFW